MSQQVYDAHTEANRKAAELKRIGKLLKDKRFNLIVMNEYLHQDDEGDESIKKQLKWAEEQYNLRTKKVQDDIEKTEKAIVQQNRKYELMIETKRNEIETYKRKKEAEIAELESMRELAVGKHKNKADDLERKADAKYYWDKIQSFSAKLNGAKRKTLGHIRLEKEVQSLEQEYEAIKARISELNNIVSPGLANGANAANANANVLVRTVRKSPAHSVVSSMDDISSINSAELEETHNEISKLEQLQAQARAEAEADRRKMEQEKADKIRKVQEHNAAVRIRIKEAEEKEYKLKEGTPEREAARKERQRIERELIR
jgi:hypothetical protein